MIPKLPREMEALGILERVALKKKRPGASAERIELPRELLRSLLTQVLGDDRREGGDTLAGRQRSDATAPAFRWSEFIPIKLRKGFGDLVPERMGRCFVAEVRRFSGKLEYGFVLVLADLEHGKEQVDAGVFDEAQKMRAEGK